MYDDDDGQAWHQLMLEKQQWEEENKKAGKFGDAPADLRSPFQCELWSSKTDDSRANHQKLEEI